MLNFFDVIWLYDRSINPQKWKMQACIDFDAGWFLRINTRDRIRPCVPISKAENEFLEHDSHVDCSINEIDEYEIEDAVRREGVIGTMSYSHASDILNALQGARYISQRDKDALNVIFDPYLW